MEVRSFSDLDESRASEWMRFLGGALHQHPRQHLKYAEVERAIGHKPLFVIGRIENAVRVVALFSLRRSWISSNCYSEAIAFSGPVFDDIRAFERFLVELVRLPVFSTVGRIRISPYWVGADAIAVKSVFEKLGWHTAEVSDFRETGIVDLIPTEDKILSSFSKSARREIRRAERQGVSVRPIHDIVDANVFFESLNRLRERRGLPTLHSVEYQAVHNHILTDPHIGRLFGAYRDSEFLGGLLVYRGAHTAHGRHFTTEAQSLKELSNLRVAPLLWWSAMAWARLQGCKYFDVEGYSSQMERTDPRYNIYKYKGEFGPRMAVRVSEHYRVTSRVLHFPIWGIGMAKRVAKQAFRRLKGIGSTSRAVS